MGIIPKVVLAAIFTFMAVLECSGVQLKIISFNIQNFGKPDKLWDDIVLRNVSAPAMELSQLLREYDIIHIQEVKGATSERVLMDLKDILNNRLSASNMEQMCSEEKYELVWPGCYFDAIGNRETYAYYINTDKIEYWEAVLYPSRRFDHGKQICPDYGGLGEQERCALKSTDKWFVRPPYSLCVKDHYNKTCLFFLLGLHAKPLDKRDSKKPDIRTTKEELDNFAVAYDYFSRKYKTPHALLMGDLNADGSYLTDAQFEYLELTERGHEGWIPFTSRKKHTNINGDSGGQPATYDRFYATTSKMRDAVKHTAQVVYDQTIPFPQISDHYPIAIKIHCGKFELIPDYKMESFHRGFSEDEDDQKY